VYVGIPNVTDEVMLFVPEPPAQICDELGIVTIGLVAKDNVTVFEFVD
jgi:hypothetical protein